VGLILLDSNVIVGFFFMPTLFKAQNGLEIHQTRSTALLALSGWGSVDAEARPGVSVHSEHHRIW